MWPFGSWRREVKLLRQRLAKHIVRIVEIEAEHDALETRLEKLEERMAIGFAGCDERLTKLEDPGRRFLLVPRGARVKLSDHFEADPTCPIGQLHELGPARWAVHPHTLADLEAKRLESVQLHTYDKPGCVYGDPECKLEKHRARPEPRPEPLRVPVLDGAKPCVACRKVLIERDGPERCNACAGLTDEERESLRLEGKAVCP